ncbi:relaxase/mobilization nuclease domain-containing protein, partial [Streptococcus suis]
FLFSLSLNPPQGIVASEEELRRAADRAEKALGLDDQPRAIVFHEKNGRRHAHVVWSRIDPERLTAINLPHYKNRLTALSRELYLEHDWPLPN